MKKIVNVVVFVIIVFIASCSAGKKAFVSYQKEYIANTKIYIEVDSVRMLVDSNLLEKLSVVKSSRIKTNIEESFKNKKYIISDSNNQSVKILVKNIALRNDKVTRDLTYNAKKGKFDLDTLKLNYSYSLYDKFGNEIQVLNLNDGLGEQYEIKEKLFGFVTSILGNKEWDMGYINQPLMIKHLGFSANNIDGWSRYIGVGVAGSVILQLKQEYLKNKNIKLSFFNKMYFYLQ